MAEGCYPIISSSFAISRPRWLPRAYPTIPAPRPVTRTALLRIAMLTMGTKGGELMKATDDMTIESASTRMRRQMMACMTRDTNTANDMNAIWYRPFVRSNFEKSAMVAIARLKM